MSNRDPVCNSARRTALSESGGAKPSARGRQSRSPKIHEVLPLAGSCTETLTVASPKLFIKSKSPLNLSPAIVTPPVYILSISITMGLSKSKSVPAAVEKVADLRYYYLLYNSTIG